MGISAYLHRIGNELPFQRTKTKMSNITWNLTEGKTNDVTKENQKEFEVEIPETQASEEIASEECKDEKNEPEIHFGKMEELVEKIDADIDQIEEEKKIVDGHLERAEAMMEEDLEEAANELENMEEESIDIFKE